jgi:pantoate--beta-alanine ligase
MQIITNINQLQQFRKELKGNVAFVPTMGALHAGHMSLVEVAKNHAEHVIVSIFVNPLQFGANEDLSRYPKPFERDVALLQEAGVAGLFAPSPDILYPQGFATTVNITNDMDKVLCGAHRTGHFAGVCTVVALLFSLVRPHIALFGEKDWQQLAIIKRMNADLRLVAHIIGVPTMREEDGLATSSRNQYLNEAERKIAPVLYKVMQEIKNCANEHNLNDLLEQGKAKILQAGFAGVDYLEVRNEESLALSTTPLNSRLFVAAHLGRTRLIDNIAL